MNARRDYNPEQLAQVAQICAQASGIRSNVAAVMQHFDASATTARKLIAAARKAGHYIENATSARYPAPPLVCSCGWSCVLDEGVPGLTRHTLSVHGRYPSRVERTPGRVAA